MMFQNPPPPTNMAPKPIPPSGTQPISATRQTSQEVPVQDPKGMAFGGRNQPITFDGKRMRKAVMRKTIDYNAAIIKHLETRKWFKAPLGRLAMQPDESYFLELLPPVGLVDNPINAVTTKFVRTSTNKLRCPIFCVVWTPEGRRLVTGASSGEFTLWNGLTFNFETILQAHESPVRSMVWSHNDSWLLSGDHSGFVKYWQSNMNNVQMYEAHHEPIRGLSFSPTDNKFASCADDGLVKIWDFYRCAEEKVLRGHGADVKCVEWHPFKSLIVSGSKDSQQPVKLWDPRSGNSLTTIHAHKSTVMQIKWNLNGNWLLTASRDHLVKLFDIRMMKELQTFRGHRREATAIAWHPVHETLFTSGGSDGSMFFWLVGAEKDVGTMESAHDGMVWSLAWHPLGHILCSGSNDHSSKFWTRNRLGDKMKDKYNLNIQDGDEDTGEFETGGSIASNAMVIPGMDTAYNTLEPDLPSANGFDDDIVLPGLGKPKNNEQRSASTRLDASDKQGGAPRFGDPPKNSIPGFGSPDRGPMNQRTVPNQHRVELRPDAPPFLPNANNRFQGPNIPGINPGFQRQDGPGKGFDGNRPWDRRPVAEFGPGREGMWNQGPPDEREPPPFDQKNHSIALRGPRDEFNKRGPGENYQQGPPDSFQRNSRDFRSGQPEMKHGQQHENIHRGSNQGPDRRWVPNRQAPHEDFPPGSKMEKPGLLGPVPGAAVGPRGPEKFGVAAASGPGTNPQSGPQGPIPSSGPGSAPGPGPGPIPGSGPGPGPIPGPSSGPGPGLSPDLGGITSMGPGSSHGFHPTPNSGTGQQGKEHKLGILGPPPNQQQGPPRSDKRPGILGPPPGPMFKSPTSQGHPGLDEEQRLEDHRRGPPPERHEDGPQRFPPPDEIRPHHPNNLSSRGFRHGAPRGRGQDHLQHEQEHEVGEIREDDMIPETFPPPFSRNLTSRGFKHGRGRGNRPPEDPRNRPPIDPRNRPTDDPRNRPPEDHRNRQPEDTRNRIPEDLGMRPPDDPRNRPLKEFRNRPIEDPRNRNPEDIHMRAPEDPRSRPPLVEFRNRPDDSRNLPPAELRNRPIDNSRIRPDDSHYMPPDDQLRRQMEDPRSRAQERGQFQRQGNWGSPIQEGNQGPPQEHRGPPKFGEGPPFGRAPLQDNQGDPRRVRSAPPDRRPSNPDIPRTQEDSKPAIRPLMSISPPPIPPGKMGMDFDLDSELQLSGSGRGRKRSFDGEERDHGPPSATGRVQLMQVPLMEEWHGGPGRGREDHWAESANFPDDKWNDRDQFPEGERGRGRGRHRGGLPRGRGGMR